MKKFRIVLCFLVIAVITANAQEKDFPKLTGPYLGQTLPGLTPEIFAQGIISVSGYYDFKGSFSPDGKEYYFYRLSSPSDELIPTVFFSRIEKGVWTKPGKFNLTQGISTFHPCVSFDNHWLFFYWQFEQGNLQKSGIYASERTDTSWSTPKYAGSGMYLTSDNSGRLYTTESVWGNNPKHYIATVTFNDGVFKNYERLKINSHYGNQTHPCIALDDSYIIYDTDNEISTMFVCFKDKTGNWSESIDLAQYGIMKGARGAYISPDGKYLFFSGEGDIWWVDIKIIENLRPKK